MSKKKIISIEDRIPKLKERRKKKANRRLIIYLSLIFALILIIIYFQSPLSDIKKIDIKGNELLSDEEVIEQSGINVGDNIWGSSPKKIRNALIQNHVIYQAEVNRKLPRTIEITLEEFNLLGYIVEDDKQYPVLNNGERLAHQQSTGDAPLFVNFTDRDQLDRALEEFEELPKYLFNLISEVHWDPTENNQHKIIVYMNDGYMVSGTIRDFANKMKVYPSIVSQLDSDQKGIVHIGAGAYFEDFTEEEAEELEEERVQEQEEVYEEPVEDDILQEEPEEQHEEAVEG